MVVGSVVVTGSSSVISNVPVLGLHSTPGGGGGGGGGGRRLRQLKLPG